MSNPLETIKVTECSCKACRKMCRRPCFGTPEDIEKLIEAGFSDRLMLDFHCGLVEGTRILLLCPALKGSEGGQTPYLPFSESGCTFWHYGKCKLHESKLKPLSGKLAYHDEAPNPDNLSGGIVGAYVAETWNTDKGRALVERWCKEHNVPMEEPIPTTLDAFRLLAHVSINTLPSGEE